ncbi:hypothetical protein PFDG_05255 [Plasmodium falciparum Dd2]|uniref:Uncharacterized protein n=1 Tax=Plasmodium falciparum (isolate Dd2) TaxID=57267 RepID=A0A0L7MA53_PLAF4|nr:hypothetical protein PFDG_05255 [Plasmodium falciparum Dd2]
MINHNNNGNNDNKKCIHMCGHKKECLLIKTIPYKMYKSFLCHGFRYSSWELSGERKYAEKKKKTMI